VCVGYKLTPDSHMSDEEEVDYGADSDAEAGPTGGTGAAAAVNGGADAGDGCVCARGQKA